jgi:hypothetical protein
MKKNAGLRDERLLEELKRKGSLALPSKNDAGVRISKKDKRPDLPIVKGAPKPTLQQIPPSSKVERKLELVDPQLKKDDPNFGYISEKEIDGGIVSGKLIRPKYNIDELKKSIDTNIFELIPQSRPEGPAMVLKSIYDDALERIDDLTIEVQNLNIDISELNAKISELEIVSESLVVQADNEILRANISENQATIANQQIATSTVDLQNAIQNSINEAIQRVSLTARNEALLQENTTLREQLFGQSAQLAAGAEALSETVAVNSMQKDPVKGDIYGFAKKKSKGGWQGWQAGQKFEIVNSGNESISVTLTKGGDSSWYSLSPVGGTPFTVPAGETKSFELSPNKDQINGRRPTGLGKAREYDGTLTVELSTGESVIFNTKLRKVRK